jgi:TusA-related sulfurtransferase
MKKITIKVVVDDYVSYRDIEHILSYELDADVELIEIEECE